MASATETDCAGDEAEGGVVAGKVFIAIGIIQTVWRCRSQSCKN